MRFLLIGLFSLLFYSAQTQVLVTNLVNFDAANYAGVEQSYVLRGHDTLVSFHGSTEESYYYRSLINESERWYRPGGWKIERNYYASNGEERIRVFKDQMLHMDDSQQPIDRVMCTDYDEGNKISQYVGRWDYSSNTLFEQGAWVEIHNYNKKEDYLETWFYTLVEGRRGRQKVNMRAGDTILYEWTALDGSLTIRDNYETQQCQINKWDKETKNSLSLSHGPEAGSVFAEHGGEQLEYRWFQNESSTEKIIRNGYSREVSKDEVGRTMSVTEEWRTVNRTSAGILYKKKAVVYDKDSTVVEEMKWDSISGQLLETERRLLDGFILYKEVNHIKENGDRIQETWNRVDGKLKKSVRRFPLREMGPIPVFPRAMDNGYLPHREDPFSLYDQKPVRFELNYEIEDALPGTNKEEVYFIKGDSVYSLSYLKGVFERELDYIILDDELKSHQFTIDLQSSSTREIGIDSTGSTALDERFAYLINLWLEDAEMQYGGLHYYVRFKDGRVGKRLVPKRPVSVKLVLQMVI